VELNFLTFRFIIEIVHFNSRSLNNNVQLYNTSGEIGHSILAH
jgi:hypothetical protein